MNLLTFLPLLDGLVPTAKQIVAANITNPVELALINGLIDVLKAVGDAYALEQKAN